MDGTFLKNLAVAVIVLFCGILIHDIYDKPKIVFVAQYEEEICPRSLDFLDCEDKTTDFKIKLQNTGGDGVIWMSISSEQLLSKSPNKGQFNRSTAKEWYLNSKGCGDYNFKIKLNTTNGEYPENVTIETVTGCYADVWGLKFNGRTIKKYCSYNRTMGGHYKLM